jgi:hypothetical protein
MTVDPGDPVRRQEPHVDPGLAPDPKHEVDEDPPEGAGPTRSDHDD